MRRVVVVEPYHLEMRDGPVPKPGPGEALVRVRRIGVCGSDLHAIRGRQPYFTYPRVLGHEISAEVAELGDNPEGLSRGEPCVVSPHLWCGTCIACRQGKTNCCTHLKLLGVHVDGGMQEYLVVPQQDHGRSHLLCRIPASISGHGIPGPARPRERRGAWAYASA